MQHLNQVLTLTERLNINTRKTSTVKAPNNNLLQVNNSDQRRRHLSAPDNNDGQPDSVVPPKQLLLYIVRMGSFTSAPKILNDDTQDNLIAFPVRLSRDELLQKCHTEHKSSVIKRSFKKLSNKKDCVQTHNGENSVDESTDNIRIFQWNVLSQALGQVNDNFACCPEEALDWSKRRYKMLEEMLEYGPDIICLQEVDHYKFLSTALASQGYKGLFCPKPDSPCIYIRDNNGPDGCAIFYKSEKFKLISTQTKILQVWTVQSNQVGILMNLLDIENKKEICIVTTHLKARHGPLLATLRHEQGKDLLKFISNHAQGRPIILSGDFNAEPNEAVYSTIVKDASLNLASAYAEAYDGNEPPYTTWKIRESEGEICHTIDYIFYSKNHFNVDAVLEFPTDSDIGPERIPSLKYPSDHFSLICDFKFKS